MTIKVGYQSRELPAQKAVTGRSQSWVRKGRSDRSQNPRPPREPRHRAHNAPHCATQHTVLPPTKSLDFCVFRLMFRNYSGHTVSCTNRSLMMDEYGFIILLSRPPLRQQPSTFANPLSAGLRVFRVMSREVTTKSRIPLLRPQLK